MIRISNSGQASTWCAVFGRLVRLRLGSVVVKVAALLTAMGSMQVGPELLPLLYAVGCLAYGGACAFDLLLWLVTLPVWFSCHVRCH